MKKIIIWVLIVFVVAVIANLIYAAGRNYLFSNRAQIKVTEAARSSLLNVFPEAKIKEIMIEPSDEYVNFVCDKLYKAEILYEKESKFKKITFNIGVYRGRFIAPSELELLNMDREAKVIFEK